MRDTIIIIFMRLFNFHLTLAKWDMQYQYTVIKDSFLYKNKMLLKDNGAIKSIMNKNVKTSKLNFRTKIMNKTNF